MHDKNVLYIFYCVKQINRVPENVVIPKGKYPIFFYGTHET